MPLLGGVLGAVLGSLDALVDKSVSLPADLTYSSSTASTVLSALVGATAALVGFVVTVTVLVVQMATGAFSARYMRVWYRDRVLKALLALLIASLAFAFALLRRVEANSVPNLGVSVTGVLLLACLVLFLIFLDRSLHRLRPVAVAALAAGYVHRDFGRAQAAVAAEADIFWGSFAPLGDQAPSLVVHGSRPGAIQAIHVRGLLRWARRHGALVVIRYMIGDFVPAGARLIEVYGAGPMRDRDDAELRGMVALGSERTVEQDPAFAIRIMVDIADLALSPAVNDPTTAVQVLDHLSDVLREIGGVDLSAARRPATMQPRSGVVVKVRRWEDYLTLGVTEIREYGSGAVQVVRRLRALLEELREEVAPDNRLAVEEELGRLDATVARTFGDSIDLDRAGTADAQGIGGRTDPPLRTLSG